MLPNLVIAGAPKCGTSSLHRWLDDHPAACGSRPKELFYLMDEGHPLRQGPHEHSRERVERYEQFFTHCSAAAQVRFEATTHYVYQRTAREVLADLPTEPLVLFMLRKPAERVRSSFRFTKNNLANISREMSFARYVEAVLNGNFDENVKQHFYDPASAHVLKRDVQYSRYVEPLAQWRKHLGEARMLIMLFEDMKKCPRSLMKQVAARVGIAPGFYDDYDFGAQNKSYRVRNKWVHRWARYLNDYFGNGWLKEAAKRSYLAVQQKKQERGGEEDERAFRKLERYFAPYNRQLADEFDLSLAAWSTSGKRAES